MSTVTDTHTSSQHSTGLHSTGLRVVELRFTDSANDELAQFTTLRLRNLLEGRFDVVSGPTSEAAAADIVVETEPTSPLLDENLLVEMLTAAEQTGRDVISRGAIPGTSPLRVSTPATATPEDCLTVHTNTQHEYGTQFNVKRPNRRKIFAALRRRMPLETMALKDILAFLSTEQGRDEVLKYGEPVELERYESCPSCQSDFVYPIQSSSSHPAIGFVTRGTSFYEVCGSCGLAFLNPSPKSECVALYYDEVENNAASWLGRLDEIYENLSEENTSHLENYQMFFSAYRDRLGRAPTIADWGGGVGQFCAYAKKELPEADVMLFDYNIEGVAAALAKLGISASHADVTHFRRDEEFDLVTMWEVIEHQKVDKLPTLLDNVAASLKPGGLLALSTPDFENPYAQALDFWAAFPGPHLTVLSRRVLEPLLNAAGLTVIDEFHACVTLKAPGRWFAYAAEAHAPMGPQGEARIIDDFLKDTPRREQFRSWLRQENLGSELILVCEKAA